MKTLIDKINQFESLQEQTVYEFNKIFIGNEITEGRLQSEVEIGIILGPVNVREVFVDGKSTRHEFTTTTVTLSDILAPVSFTKLNSVPGRKFHNKEGVCIRTTESLTTNAALENLVMEEKEMELEPIEYMLLQYFRGCQSPYHTQLEIASKLRKSSRGVRDILKRMEQKNIIKTQVVQEFHRMTVEISEEWA